MKVLESLRRRAHLLLSINLLFLQIPLSAEAAPPSAPTSVAVQVEGNGYLQISFTTAAGATNYQYSIDAGITWTTPDPAITSSPLTIHGLTNGTSYQVSLKSVNAAGELSSATTAVTGTPNPKSAISNGYAFLMGGFVEVGVRPNGAFGSPSGSVPSGFHASSGIGLGFRADRSKDGWGQTTDDGDFFTPGSPYEGWTLKVDSTYASNDDSNGSPSSGSCNTSAGVQGCLSNVVTAGGSQTVDWKSSADVNSVSISKKYSVSDAGQSLHIDVTLTNNSAAGSAAKTIYYGRGVDPDNYTAGSGTMTCNGANLTYGIYQNCNTVVSQGSETSVALVKGEWGNGSLIALRSSDSGARVARQTSGFSNVDPQTWWNAGNTRATSGTYLGNLASTGADAGMYLAVKKSLSPGESTSFRISYVLTLNDASVPTVTTRAASEVGVTSTAKLNATVNPNGDNTSVEFEYGTSSDLSGSTTKVTAGSLTGSSDQTIDKSISGLTPGTTYYFRVKATNSTGTSTGSILSFTPIAAPTAKTLAPTSIGDTSAVLNATINPRGGSTSSITFTYGTSPGLTSGNTSVTSSPSSASGTSDTSVVYSLSGLTAGGVYYYRVSVTNEAGTTNGEIVRFQTTPAPVVTTSDANNIALTSAQLNGSVNVFSTLTPTIYFEYSTDITFSTPETSVATPSSVDSPTAVSVSTTISGLTTGTTYYFRLFAENANGSNYGSPLSFVPKASPIATTESATVLGPTAATMKGTINARGSTTTSIVFEYSTNSGLATSARISATPSSVGGVTTTNVEANLSGLTKQSTYYYRVIAANALGTDTGVITSFVTPDADSDSPTVTISTDTLSGNSNTSTPIEVTITFNEPVTGFTASDLAVTGTSASGWSKGSLATQSSSVYKITLSPSSPPEGTLILNIAANSARDLSNNGNIVASSVTLTISNSGGVSGGSTAPAPVVATYRVTYLLNGGDAGFLQVASGYGQGAIVAVISQIPTRNGFAFQGWNTSADGTGTKYISGDSIRIGTANVDLYATWEKLYTITFNINGGEANSLPTSVNTVVGTVVTFSNQTPQRIGHTFLSWNSAFDGSASNYLLSDSITVTASNLTLYAQWKINTYTLTFDSNGDPLLDIKPQTRDYASNITISEFPDNYVRIGYTFLGWNTKKDGTGETFLVGTTFTYPATDTILYAQWKINSYTIAFDGNGVQIGRVPASVTQEYNSSFAMSSPSKTFTRKGYTFQGWNTSKDGAGKNYLAGDFFTVGGVNQTLYARWVPNTYKVTFLSAFQLSSIRGEFTTGGSVSKFPTPEARIGYKFVGWSTSPFKTNIVTHPYTPGVTRNVSLYAVWEKNK